MFERRISRGIKRGLPAGEEEHHPPSKIVGPRTIRIPARTKIPVARNTYAEPVHLRARARLEKGTRRFEVWAWDEEEEDIRGIFGQV